MTDVYNWDDYIIEIVQESGGKLVTVGVLNDAKLLQFPVSLYGRGDRVGSLSLHVLSSNALTMTAEAMTFLKVYRRGQHMRDFIVGKEDWGLDAKSAYLDEYIKLQIEPLEKVIGFAVCQPEDPEGTFAFPAGPADDAIKWAVSHAQGADAYADPDSTSRVLSYLTVDADSSDGPVIAETEITNGNLLKMLQDWGQYWGVDFRLTLRKTTGREHDLFFETFYPRRGADRTESNGDGNKPVIFSDMLGNIGSARRYREINNLRNAIVARDANSVAVDSTSISAYWRREEVADAEDAVSLARGLADKQLRIGREFSYLTHPQQQLFADFEVGDRVTTVHHHLGLAAEDATIIEARVEIGQDLQERISFIFGEFARTLPESIQDAAGGGNNPRVPPIRYNIVGTDSVMVPFSNPLPLYDATYTIESADGSVRMVGDVGDNSADWSAGFWQRTSGSSPEIVSPLTAGDYVRVARLEIDSASDYIDVVGGDLALQASANLDLKAATAQYFYIGGDSVWTISDAGNFVPETDNRYRVGSVAKRLSYLYAFKGFFYDDVTFGTTGTGIIHTDATVDKKLLVYDGTRFVPATLADAGIAPAAHDLLSATHEDTLASAVTRGSIIVGNATPKWAELNIGAAGRVLGSDGTDVAWVTPDIYGTPGTLTVSTTNVAGANHTHAITASANPGATESLLKTTTDGYIRLVRVGPTTTEYAYLNGAGYLGLTGGTAVTIQSGGTTHLVVESGRVRPGVAATELGRNANRWTTVWGQEGDFSGDVTIASSKGVIITGDVTAGKVLKGDGTRYAPGTISMSDLSDGHSAVTLSSAANTNLLSLTGQEIGLDSQSANRIFAGPASGSGTPTFRAMVLADLVSHKLSITGRDSTLGSYNSVSRPSTSGFNGYKTTSWNALNPNYASNPLRLADGTIIYLLDSAFGTSDDATHTAVYIGNADHYHYLELPTYTGSTPTAP